MTVLKKQRIKNVNLLKCRCQNLQIPFAQIPMRLLRSLSVQICLQTIIYRSFDVPRATCDSTCAIACDHIASDSTATATSSEVARMCKVWEILKKQPDIHLSLRLMKEVSDFFCDV